MLRIDEIYNHTFWPWLQKNRPGYRLFFCDPFGRSDPESIKNYGSDTIQEHNYIFCFDQEPIHLPLHNETFKTVWNQNWDLTHKWSDFIQGSIQHRNGYLITSERDSQAVEEICRRYGLRSLYYFFHGWAALDWFRGYDRTFLIHPCEQRRPTKIFLAPNRIIAGERKHRLDMLYWIFKLGLTDNHISCPVTCPVENISIYDAINNLPYPDRAEVFGSVDLPISFDGETNHPMHSCWLSLFEEAADSLLYLVTETVANGRRHHLTEKTFKPIALGMPFVLVSTAGSLQYLRSYGFKTFSDFWDESYDLEPNDQLRVEKIANLLQNLQQLTVSQRCDLYHAALPVIKHNWQHFYSGGFESTLWNELVVMLDSIEQY